ncbi:MAG TPA: hypothetical protein GX733_08675 [Tissierellia bacterium]|nr:hypothetical protein [Tissierellia bacterium]
MANERMMRRVAYIAITFLVAMGWLQGLFYFIPFSPTYLMWGTLALLALVGGLWKTARLPYKLPLFFLLSQVFFWELSSMLKLSKLATSAVHLVFLILLLLILAGKRAVHLCCPGRLSDRVHATRRWPGTLGKLRWTKLSLIGAVVLYLGMSLAIYLSRGNWGIYGTKDPFLLADGILSALTILFYHFVGPMLLVEPRLDDESTRILLVLFYAFPLSGLFTGILSIVYAWFVVKSLQETRGLLAAIVLTLGHAMGILFPLQGFLM